MAELDKIVLTVGGTVPCSCVRRCCLYRLLSFKRYFLVFKATFSYFCIKCFSYHGIFHHQILLLLYSLIFMFEMNPNLI